MIAEKALALAGPGARLVRRPRGVPHVYVGPLTPSGRYVPRAGQAVCRAHTGRLSVLSPRGASSLEHPESRPAGLGAVCARCSARLGRSPRRAGQSLTSRAAYLRAYAGTSKADVAVALELALTPAEVDAAAHLSLLLFDVAGCTTTFVDDSGREWRSLHQMVHRARGRVGGFPESHSREHERASALSAEARDQRTRENKAARAERETSIGRLGISIAVPVSDRPARRSPRRRTTR